MAVPSGRGISQRAINRDPFEKVGAWRISNRLGFSPIFQTHSEKVGLELSASSPLKQGEQHLQRAFCSDQF